VAKYFTAENPESSDMQNKAWENHNATKPTPNHRKNLRTDLSTD
jgi:hypothetical protein